MEEPSRAAGKLIAGAIARLLAWAHEPGEETRNEQVQMGMKELEDGIALALRYLKGGK